MASSIKFIAFLLLLFQVSSSIDFTLLNCQFFQEFYEEETGYNCGNTAFSIEFRGDAVEPVEKYMFHNPGQLIWLTADFSATTNSLSEYAVGFWVNFESTISDLVFQFGDPSSYHYLVSSTQNGKLDVTYFQDDTAPDTSINFSIDVPLNKWFCIVFDFISGSPATLKIAMSNSEVITKTSDNGSSMPFQMPSGILNFGKDINVKFYEAFVSNSYSQADPFVIKVVDDTGKEDAATSKCDDSLDCVDDVCTNKGTCLSSFFLCTSFIGDQDCQGCPDGSGLDKNTACQTCLAGNSFKSHHCNIYLGCLDSNNCASCSTSSTICDTCNSTSFLYDKDATSIMCLCKVYLACEWSCKSCNPGPECYECAETVVQVGSTCRVDKVGFQISLEGSNIIMDFAHPLSSELTKNSFKATSNTMADISTAGWTLDGCIEGSMQCKIITSNVFESDLPVSLTVEFNTA